MTDPLEHCISLARKDRAAYLCCLKLAPPARAKALALVALEVELAEIAAKVHEALLAQMRFAWWREALESKKIQGHPVLEALKDIAVDFTPMVDVAEHAWPEPPTPLSQALEEAVSGVIGAEAAKWHKAVLIARLHPGPLLPLRLLLVRG